MSLRQAIRLTHTSLEDSLDDVCPVCGQPHEADFSSVIAGSTHYHSGRCKHCGYIVDVDRSRSGAVLLKKDESARLEPDSLGKVREAFHPRGRIIDPQTGEIVTAASERKFVEEMHKKFGGG